MVPVAVAFASLVPVALGALVVRRGSHRIGWLLVAHGIFVGALLAAPGGGRSGFALVTDQLLAGAWIFLFLWVVLIAYLLPDGRPLSRRWRIWVTGGLVGAGLFMIGAAGDGDGYRQDHQGIEPPLPWLPQPLSAIVGSVGLLLVVLLFFGSTVAVGLRLRRASGDERIQLLWLVWGALAVPAGLLMLWIDRFVLGGHEGLIVVVLTAVSVALPTTIAAAIVRARLFDIRVVLSRTLTYGTLVAGVIALYAGLLVVAQWMGGDGTLGGLVAVALVAITVHPAYALVLRRVERWVYGYRSQPQEALRLLATRAEAAEPRGLTAIISEAVAELVRVDHVWIDGGPAQAIDHDRAHSDQVRIPLAHRDEQLGDLVVELPPGRGLSTADRALLEDLARYAAVLVRSERQADQLRESRSKIVTGREEERRRLRRDLHDGLGPSLATVVLLLATARSRPDGDQRVAVLEEARVEVQSAIAEVRRLVDDLRPPALDEVGLLGAIRQRALALSHTVTFEVVGPEPMPTLPAAVEVAAFRIAAEAMTNVVRHAGATRCRIEVGVDGRFEMSVADNGVGRVPSTSTSAAAGVGVGWTSMVERAAELGGRCVISNRSGGGILVHTELPMTEQHSAEVSG